MSKKEVKRKRHNIMTVDLTEYFDTPDELAAFCVLDNEGQAAVLRDLVAQGRISQNILCTLPEDTK